MSTRSTARRSVGASLSRPRTLSRTARLHKRITSNLRRPSLKDVDAVTALERHCFGEVDAFPHSVWRHLFGIAAQRGTALSFVSDNARGTIVAAATGLVRSNSRRLRLYSLAVDPESRGKGLGKKLIAALVHAAPQRCDTLTLEVRADNVAAQALYEKIGMWIDAHLPEYYPDGAHGIRYRSAFAELKL